MIDKLIHTIRKDKKLRDKFQNVFVEKVVTSKTIILNEGEVANKVYFIKKGCLREWFNKDGKDITFQFFFENQAVASFDSFMNNKPSIFTIESIEPSILLSINKDDFEEIRSIVPKFQDGFQDYLLQRFGNYSQLFLSHIKNSPQERYAELVKNHPEIIQRIPQHYIASYLGITPILLSRIRNRK